MLTEDEDSITLLRGVVCRASAPGLTLAHFAHESDALEILLPYLTQSLEVRRRGANVLIYGAPGTGKSQLARVLAQEVDSELLEVTSEDEDGDPVLGERRLRAYRAVQTFFAARRALILFDETEDVFKEGDKQASGRGIAQKHKAWMNRALEDNPIPTLWLSNSVDCLDRAFVRRFDVVVELGIPPKKARERIIATACSDLVAKKDLARLAASEELTPAVVTRAATIISSISDRLPSERQSSAVCRLVEATLLAQGHAPLPRDGDTSAPDYYDPRYVNANQDLEAIAAGLRRARTGRLCLYGPPGTGKTAFGRWLADQLQVPLYVKRVSDIASPFIGVTERNLARTFREAEAAKAILLIDEVDSFLRDRRGANRSWEVTEVNEMLTQIEAFEGVFIATTNLIEGIDQAALRRFDLKLRFGYLDKRQAWNLLVFHCQTLHLASPKEGDAVRLAELSLLTPGDFAAVVRQHRLRPLGSPVDFVAALTQECELKEDCPKHAIGFH
jgi:SpoVK/Ycf46/Vps4 family AAA+-type ATPase